MKKQKMKQTPYPRYYLRIYFKGKLVNSLATKKRLRILYRIRLYQDEFKWEKCYLKFAYTPKETNSGIYTNMKDFMLAYRCFEEMLTEYPKKLKIKIKK